MCKNNSRNDNKNTQFIFLGQETKTEICKSKPPKKKPKLISSKQICVKVYSARGNKRGVIQLNGGVMNKLIYKAKKQKVMGRSGKKTVEEVLMGMRSFSNSCVNLRNTLTTQMMNMKT